MLLRAAYDLVSTEDQWLQGLADSAVPVMNVGFGAFAFKTDVPTSKMVSFVSSSAPPWVRDCICSLQAAANSSEVATATGTMSRYMTLSQSFGHARWLGLDITKRYVLPYGVEDASSINVLDPAGKYLIVIGTVQRKARAPTRAEDAHWTRVSSHLVAACRLRERLLAAAGSPQPADGEAILTPAGSVEHAIANATPRSARDILREAVRSRERALAGMSRSSSQGALDLWKGLVEGRWSLVDRFDSDGRRYVIAHANAPRAPGPRRLTAQERDVTAIAAAGLPIKIIAYELGLSVPRVSNILRHAMAKIGVTSRAELVRVYAGIRNEREDA